jgi:hypothetical protein
MNPRKADELTTTDEERQRVVEDAERVIRRSRGH